MGSSKTDAVWVYALNYGGGIVSVSSFSFVCLFVVVNFFTTLVLCFFLHMTLDFGFMV